MPVSECAVAPESRRSGGNRIERLSAIPRPIKCARFTVRGGATSDSCATFAIGCTPSAGGACTIISHRSGSGVAGSVVNGRSIKCARFTVRVGATSDSCAAFTFGLRRSAGGPAGNAFTARRHWRNWRNWRRPARTAIRCRSFNAFANWRISAIGAGLPAVRARASRAAQARGMLARATKGP